MNATQKKKILAFLGEQSARFEGLLSRYAWPYEEARWQELVFCILSAEGQELFEPPEHRRRARRAVDILASCDLLEVADLAAMIDGQTEVSEDDPLILLRRGILERLGYDTTTVDRILLTLAETARTLQVAFDGKVQRYLRQAGERMVREMFEIFSMSGLGEARKRYVLTHWLQNVVNMPLGIHNPSMLLLCQSFGVTPDEFIETADEKNINLALVDDMAIDFVECYVAQKHAEKDA